jgi:SHS2 domain-containing protein
MYEHFEHTADLGLRVQAPDVDTLFAEAAEALTAAIVEDVTAIEAREDATFRIAGDDKAFLLFDWLRAILMKFEMDHMLFRRFTVNVCDTGLTATAWGEPFDPARHPLSHEVKAITYHGLSIEPSDGGWQAEVIIDI